MIPSHQNKLINYIYQLLNNSLQSLTKTLFKHPNLQDQEILMHLLLWLEFLHILESKSFLNQDPHYLVEMFKKINKDPQTARIFPAFGNFLNALFTQMVNATPPSTDNPFISNKFLGNILIIGKNLLKIGEDQMWPIFPPEQIPDTLFYSSQFIITNFPCTINAITPRIIQTLPIDIPLLNMLEIQKPFDAEITEFVFGALFEKFLTMSYKRTTGSYYTPQKISRYIVTEVIRESIQRHSGVKIDKIDEKIDPTQFSLFWQNIQSIHILDPALGTGHFLISACHELMNYYDRLWELVQKHPKSLTAPILLYDSTEIKKMDIFKIPDKQLFHFLIKLFLIFPYNVYGVDLNANAIVIAKLRCFLDLISDLPNTVPYFGLISSIQLNIKWGHSLIGMVDAPPDLLNHPVKNLRSLFSENKSALQPFLGNDASKFEDLYSKDNVKISILLSLKEQIQQTYPRIIAISHRLTLDHLLKDLSMVLWRESQNFFKQMSSTVLESTSPNSSFHWGIEFPTLFGSSLNLPNKGATLVVGNPPYGNILSPAEKEYCKNYASFQNEIAAVFIERIIALQQSAGFMGLVVSYAITFSKDLSKTREKIAYNYKTCKIATFDRDKCRFFEGVTQSVSILLCSEKKAANVQGNLMPIPQCEFFTTQMYRTMPDLTEMQFQLTNPFLLGEKIGTPISDSHRIPKLGNIESIEILQKLSHNILTLKNYTHPWKILGNPLPNPANNLGIWVRISGNYWYNAWDRAPYSGTQIAYLAFSPENQMYRNFCLLLLNSSLYYWWFRIFSDGRHMNADIMNAFPIPSDFAEKWSKWQNLISHFLPILMNVMFTNFDADHNRFLSSRFKGILDLCDLILVDFYVLSEAEIHFIMNYEPEIRGGIKRDPIFEKYLIEFRMKPSETLETNFINQLNKKYLE